jgi:hypothetical protein
MFRDKYVSILRVNYNSPVRLENNFGYNEIWLNIIDIKVQAMVRDNYKVGERNAMKSELIIELFNLGLYIWIVLWRMCNGSCDIIFRNKK